MILKVYDPNTSRWVFFDRIESVYVARRIYQEAAIPPVGSMETDFLPEEVEKGDISVTEVGLCFATARLKPALVRLQTGNGYLLNDEGKTVERL